MQTQNEKMVPSLKALLNPSEVRVQSFDEQHAALLMLSQTYGGSVKRRDEVHG